MRHVGRGSTEDKVLRALTTSGGTAWSPAWRERGDGEWERGQRLTSVWWGDHEGPVGHSERWILTTCNGLWAGFFKRIPLASVLRTNCGETERKKGDLVGSDGGLGDDGNGRGDQKGQGLR